MEQNEKISYDTQNIMNLLNISIYKWDALIDELRRLPNYRQLPNHKGLSEKLIDLIGSINEDRANDPKIYNILSSLIAYPEFADCFDFHKAMADFLELNDFIKNGKFDWISEPEKNQLDNSLKSLSIFLHNYRSQNTENSDSIISLVWFELSRFHSIMNLNIQ